MDLLSYIGQLSRRKDTLMGRAQDLLSEHKTVEGMEEEMTERNKALVARFRENRIRFSEFQRIAADETVTAAGTMALNQSLGVKSMMRVCRNDKRSCEDCLKWDGMGWRPIGSLPPPGQGCRCYDNCRCYVDYR
jgi:hypothetical protein